VPLPAAGTRPVAPNVPRNAPENASSLIAFHLCSLAAPIGRGLLRSIQLPRRRDGPDGTTSLKANRIPVPAGLRRDGVDKKGSQVKKRWRYFLQGCLGRAGMARKRNP
jgi:hypothetical protein